MKYIIFLPALLVVYGCTTVRYNGTDTISKEVDYPEIGKAIVAYVGDNMIQKGTITEESILVVNKTINGVFYDIPAQRYPQIGFDKNLNPCPPRPISHVKH